MRRRSALTLVELVLVIVMLGLLAGIAVPRLSNALRHHRLDLMTRRVMADIQLARSQAIRDKTDTSITFDMSSFSYTLQAQSGNRVAASPYTVTLKQQGTTNRIQLSSADFNGTAELRFNKFGVPNQSGSVIITDGHERAVLTVSGTTGRVSRTIFTN